MAYSVQESLEHDLEVTVWTQGIFTPSRYAMEDLVTALSETDFAAFVFAPDDITTIRGQTVNAVRDNVVFELGLFIGRIGRERSYIFVPRGSDELHLPTDLLGLTPLSYDADRTDGNLVAALGPACQRVRRAAQQLGQFLPIPAHDEAGQAKATLLDDPEDIVAMLESWMGARRTAANTSAIKFAEVDQKLGLVEGSTEKFIETAANRWGYVAARKGKQTILFRREAVF